MYVCMYICIYMYVYTIFLRRCLINSLCDSEFHIHGVICMIVRYIYIYIYMSDDHALAEPNTFSLCLTIIQTTPCM